MVEPSRRPRMPGKGWAARQRQVREAVGEARAALQETWGMPAPTVRPSFPWLQRWLSCLAAALAGLKGRFPRRRRGRSALLRHVPTLVVLLLFVSAIAGRGFGVYAAYLDPLDGAEGGGQFLLGQEASPLQEAFDFSAAPVMVTYQRPPEVDLAPLEQDLPTRPVHVMSRSDVMTYTVQAGDSLDSIAAEFGVAPYTLFWVNGLHTPQEIQPGMALTIPPLAGVPHTVRSGETLASIADKYGVRPGNIVGYPPNALRYPYSLQAGQEIFIPGGLIEIPDYYVEDGQRPPPTLVTMPGGEKLRWPTWGTITTEFGWSRFHGGFHHGVDIANSWGTPIYAAAAGTVAESGWGSLGWYVAIDHGNGFRTEYGHMAKRAWVSEGDFVEKGERIGSMGSTYGSGGYASGVHLHFAVRHRGVYIDPLPLLAN